MTSGRQFATITVSIGLAAIGHAVLTWPSTAVIAFFAGGAIVAFAGEAVVVNLGWLEHHVGPKLVGVPLYVLFGWTGVVYIAFRVSLLATAGWPAVLLAGGLSAAYDLLTDHRGVAEGHWTFTDELPGPRRREVPWWNFAGWFVVSCLTAAFAAPFL